MAQAVIRSLAQNAVKGNERAQRLFTELVSTSEKMFAGRVDVAINYKVEWDRELERRKALGIVAPDPIPHPDHIVVDLGAVRSRSKADD